MFLDVNSRSDRRHLKVICFSAGFPGNPVFGQISSLVSLISFNKTGTSKVGAISKAQKAQNIFFGKKLEIFEKKIFFRKMSHSAKKCKRWDPFSFPNMHSVAK